MLPTPRALALESFVQETLAGLRRHLSQSDVIRELGDRLPPEFSTRADTQQVLTRRKLESLVVSDGKGGVAEPPRDFS